MPALRQSSGTTVGGTVAFVFCLREEERKDYRYRVEDGQGSADEGRRGWPSGTLAHPNPPPVAGSLHKMPFAIMRYNKIKIRITSMCAATTAERTQKEFYVKVNQHMTCGCGWFGRGGGGGWGMAPIFQPDFLWC